MAYKPYIRFDYLLAPSEAESVHHYHSAAILAHGYSVDIHNAARKSFIKTVNMFKLIQYVKKHNLENKLLTQWELDTYVLDILAQHKDNKGGILVEKSCTKLFKTPLLKENKNIKEIARIEQKFLDFVINPEPLQPPEKGQHTKHTGPIYKTVYQYLKLLYARSPNVHTDYETNFFDRYCDFERDQGISSTSLLSEHLFEVNPGLGANLSWVVPDFSPVALFKGVDLLGSSRFHNLNAHEQSELKGIQFFLCPVSGQRAYVVHLNNPNASQETSGSTRQALIEKVIAQPDFRDCYFNHILRTSALRTIYAPEQEGQIVAGLLQNLTWHFDSVIAQRVAQNFPQITKHLHKDSLDDIR